MLARLSSLSLCLLLLFGLFVISHIYPAACGPKGHGSSGEILQVYPKSHPRPTILRETMRPPAPNVGASPSPFPIRRLFSSGMCPRRRGGTPHVRPPPPLIWLIVVAVFGCLGGGEEQSGSPQRFAVSMCAHGVRSPIAGRGSRLFRQ